jgi:hypothetical protein
MERKFFSEEKNEKTFTPVQAAKYGIWPVS